MKHSRLLAISMAVCTASAGRDPLLIRDRGWRLESIWAFLLFVAGATLLVIVFFFR